MTDHVATYFRMKYSKVNTVAKFIPALGILVIVVIRYWGIMHGAPLVYHVDEPALVRSAYALYFNWSIDHFDWPHFYFYINYWGYVIFAKLRSIIEIVLPAFRFYFPLIWDQNIVFYLISRFINVSFSILTVIPVYLLASKLVSRKAAIFTVFAFLLMPGLNFQSHYALPDTGLMFFISLGLYFSLLAYTSDYHLRFRYYIFSAIILGLATGIKYNGVLFVAILFIVFGLDRMRYFLLFKVVRSSQYFKAILKAVILFIIFLLSFVVTTPSLIYKWNRFWSDIPGVGLLWQLRSNLRVVSLQEYPNEVYQLFVDLITNTNLVMVLIWLVLPIVLFLDHKRYLKYSKRNSFVFVCWLFILGYFLNTARYQIAGFRFLVPIVPILLILAVYSLNKLINLFKIKRQILYAIIGLVFVQIFYQTVFISYRFAQTSTYNLFYQKANTQYFDSKIYIRGENLERLNELNRLKFHRFKAGIILNSGDLLFIENPSVLANLSSGTTVSLIDKIDCGQRCIGPSFYIYKVD